METIRKVKLEYCKGSSDKVYIIKLLKHEDDLYKVRFEYGKYYNVNNVYYKPDNFTSYEKAMTIFENTLNQKLKKGYVEC